MVKMAKKKQIKPWKYVLIGVGATIGVLFLLIVIIGSIPFSEVLFDEVNTVNFNETLYYVFDAEEYDEIDVDFEVIEGGEVNLVLMNAAGFSDYMDKDTLMFDYIAAGTSYPVRAKTYTYEIRKSGSYYIVIDNADTLYGGAEPVDDVNVRLKVVRRY
jgi:hypothetical protein